MAKRSLAGSLVAFLTCALTVQAHTPAGPPKPSAEHKRLGAEGGRDVDDNDGGDGKFSKIVSSETQLGQTADIPSSTLFIPDVDSIYRVIRYALFRSDPGTHGMSVLISYRTEVPIGKSDYGDATGASRD